MIGTFPTEDGPTLTNRKGFFAYDFNLIVIIAVFLTEKKGRRNTENN